MHPGHPRPNRPLAASLLRWPGFPPSELGAGLPQALSHGVGGAGKATVARCSGSAPNVYLPCKVARTPVPLGQGVGRTGGLPASPPSTPTAALSPGRPHLSGQQEFPFFCLPQLHHVRQRLNRCRNTKKYTTFLMHAKETLPVSPIVPPCPPPHQNMSLFPPGNRGHPRGEPRIKIQWVGCEPAAPRTRRRQRAGSGCSCWGWGDEVGVKTPHEALRAPQPEHLECGPWAARLGGTKLQEAGPLRGTRARHTKRGLRPGRRGPRTKAPGRERLAVPKPRDCPALQLYGAEGRGTGRCGQKMLSAENCNSFPSSSCPFPFPPLALL